MKEDEDQTRTVEDLDDAEVIWPGGPTAGQIKLWKRRHGDVYVTSLTSDRHIIWRPITRLEYRELVAMMETLVSNGELSKAQANMWNEEAITRVCLLYPNYSSLELSNEIAGLPSLLSQEILEASGFVAKEVRKL